jgi:hypothetical protein
MAVIDTCISEVTKSLIALLIAYAILKEGTLGRQLWKNAGAG